MSELLEIVTKTLSDKQAEDMTIIDMHAVNPFTDYFEIAGSNFEIHTYTFTDVLGKVLARIKGSSG